MTLDRWHKKETISNLSHAPRCYVFHLPAIHEFKLEFSSGNIQIGGKLSIFQPLWPWNLMDDLKQGKSEGFDNCNQPSNLTLKLDSNRWFFCPFNLEIWWMTSKNNKAPLLYHVKHWASFQSHWWIKKLELQSRNAQFRVKIGDFLSCVT